MTCFSMVAAVLAATNFLVTDYGAKGDGRTLDTDAIQKAIDACSEAKGGRVVLPAGTYLSGTVFLKSKVDLHLEKGATLLGSPDLKDYNADDAYPQNWGSKAEGWGAKHLIIAVEVEDVAISGDGTVDGNGRAFFDTVPSFTGKITWRDGGINAKMKGRRPGQTIVFVESKKIRVSGVKFRDMTCWSCFFYGCEKVRVKGVDVRNDLRHLNTDGFDVDSCRDVEISDCNIETGDDAFAVRGSPMRLKNTNRPCEDVYIHDCTGRVSACGVRVGVGNGAIRNVRFGNLVFTRAGRGISVQCNYGSGKGGVDISDVSFENVTIRDAGVGITVTGGMGIPTAKLSDITFRNVDIEAEIYPIRVTGQGRTRPQNILFENVSINGDAVKGGMDDGEAGGEDGIPGADEPIRILAADNVILRNVMTVTGGTRAPARVATRDVGPLDPAKGGFTVKTASAAKSWERTAAADLERYLVRRLGSAALTAGGETGLRFHVGDTDFAAAKGLSSGKLADEEWVVSQFGRDIVVNGGGTRGCLYAAYHFLEDLCGVRFWSEMEEDVPGPSALDLQRIDLRGKPAFAYRDIYRTLDARVSQSLLAIRRRLNRNGDVPVPMDCGGSFDYGSPRHCHTFNSYVNWTKLGKSNPELFSLVDGKRCGGQDYTTGGQLCLSNPEVKDLVSAGVRKALAESAEKAVRENRVAPRLFEVSMNDNKRYCQCEKCKAAYARTSISDVYFNFYNDIASEVAQVRPDAYVTTLAYYETEELPKSDLRIRDNLLVKLCNTRSNKAVSILHPDNKVFRDFILGWKRKTEHLFIWDYAITYTKDSKGFPFPSEFHYGDKFAFFRTNSVTGVFIEQEYPELNDFHDIKYYMMSRFLEDPFLDADAVLKTACCEYFGPAAGPHVYAARKMLLEASVRNKASVNWVPQVCMFNFIHAEDLAFMMGEFAAAEKATDDGRILRRIKYAKGGLMRLAERRDGMVRRCGPDGKGRMFWEFNPAKFGLYGGEGTRYVPDPKARGGKAVRIDTTAKGCGLPFRYGFYDQCSRKTIASGEVPEVPEDGCYHMTRVATIKMPENGYLYLTKDCLVQVHLPSPDFAGKSYRIGVSVRREGTVLWVDRVVYADCSDVDAENGR